MHTIIRPGKARTASSLILILAGALAALAASASPPLLAAAAPPASQQQSAATAAADSPGRQRNVQDYFGAHPFRITASSGFDFSSGDFGTNKTTDVLYVPFGLKFEWDPLIFRLTVPWERIDGNVVIVGGAPEAAPGARSRSTSGLGDIVLSGTYVYDPSPELSFLPLTEFTGKVKFGTADKNQGLGTGKNDYTLQLDFSKRFGDLTPFGTVGYKFIGDPSGFNLNNKVFASAGLTYKLHRRVNIGLAYDWAQSAVPGRDDIQDISPFATIKFGKHFAIDPYFVVGLSTPAPDWGGGIQLRFIYARE